ncbi:MAG TPA: transglycosylase domain-containing protein [Jiangellales bacterium]|nr:transglycosylase domain-containing protein [Jiangellales bacterium]
MGLVKLITSWIVAARRVTALVAVSCLAGLVVAGLAAPVVTGLGVGARDGADAFTEMPAELNIEAPAERSRMTDADGDTLAVFFEENRIEVPLDKISHQMRDAILAIEDHRFYEHGPLDIQGASRAFVGNLQAGETTGGGSTLTQQYVKLLLLDQAESSAERAEVLADSGPQGYFRKLRELRAALGVEQRMTKDQILAAYLNIANFGGPPGRSNYGVEAAARYYFSTSAEELTLPQAATLAGLVQRPSEYYPVDNPEAAIGRRNIVITRMAELGMISETEASEARQADLGLDVSESPSGCISSWAPWFCDYAVHEVLRMEELGETPEARMDLLRRGGLRIVTTLDKDVQRAADDAIEDRVAPTDSAVGTLAMVEPGTGRIKALANSREYGPEGEGRSMVNYAVDKAMGNSNGIQAGSAFKPFVLAAALDQGLEPDLELNAPAQLDVSGDWFEVCWNDQSRVRDMDYQPKNSTRGGRITMREATEWSTNTYYIQLLKRTGICEPAQIAQDSGVWKQVPDTSEPQPLDQVPSFPLGSNTVAPLGMAEAFAMFANRGEHCASFAVAEVVDRDGETVVENEPECSRVLDTDVADMTNDILRGVIETEGATGNAMRLDGDRPAAGKTGTTNGNVAVWFVGYTPQLSAAAAVADLDPPQTTLNGRTYDGERVSRAYGSTLPGPIWREAMNEALEDEPEVDFEDP